MSKANEHDAGDHRALQNEVYAEVTVSADELSRHPLDAAVELTRQVAVGFDAPWTADDVRGAMNLDRYQPRPR